MKPPNDDNKKLNQFRFNERVNLVSQKQCKKIQNDNDQKIFASMALMSGND